MQLAGAAVHVQHLALKILDENGVRRIFKQLAETPLALAQFLLDLHALQRAAALVGQRLQNLHVARGVTVRIAGAG